MSAALVAEALANASDGLSQAEVERAEAERLGERVVELVRLAGGRVETWALEPAGLLLVRAGLLDGDGLTFGSDYKLEVRSRELCRGLVEAVGRGKLGATSAEMWLTDSTAASVSTAESSDDERSQLAEAFFALPRAELEQTARRQLLDE